MMELRLIRDNSWLYFVLVLFEFFLGLIQKPPLAKMNPSSSYFTVCCWPSFRYFALNAKATSQVLLWNSMELWLSCTNIAFIVEKMLFPVVLSYWESYRSTLLNQVKDMKDVVWSGDGRYDSMGHSAKFGVYTVFCCTLMKIVHFELLQVSFGWIHQTVIVHVYPLFYQQTGAVFENLMLKASQT